MKAMVVEKFGAPLKLMEMPEPTLRSPFDILVKIRASGVCHTDLHAANGEWPVKPSLPFIPGHEGVGEVVQCGDQVDAVMLGDRVGIPWLHSACGHCEFCITGWETLCGSQKNTGYSVNGGYSELVVADSRYVGKIPDGLDYASISPHFCAGVTTYKAIKISGAAPNKTVLISGIGGLGHMALQYAVIAGARTIAVDISDEKLALATELGADHILNPLSVNIVKAVRAIGLVDIVIATAASAKSFRDAFDVIKPGGKLVIVGLPPEELPIPVFDLVLKGISIHGSIVGTRRDLQEALDLAARKLVKCAYKTVHLEDINDVFAQMRAGEIQGRVVLQVNG
jgi:alcohol dehydrogenase, propanol-preferring